jgi:aspartyl/asparaginyl-tRNA synthetase
MKNTAHYNHMVRKLRQFFQEKKGYLEVPAQSRLSILAACEQPETITQFSLNHVMYPLPQTGQMWLEYELLKNPEWPGVYCVTTSYRDEPNPIEGRHLRIFPMFEFESHGTFDELKALEEELLLHLGFEHPVPLSYSQVSKKYETEIIEAHHETALWQEISPVISLEKFPARTQPFWNMKYAGDGVYSKIDVLLYGMETIGSAERETDKQMMREQFFAISHGKYSQLLFDKFGKERVMLELEEYLALDMFPRFGAGMGLTRLARAMELAHIFEENVYVPHVTQQNAPQLLT